MTTYRKRRAMIGSLGEGIRRKPRLSPAPPGPHRVKKAPPGGLPRPPYAGGTPGKPVLPGKRPPGGPDQGRPNVAHRPPRPVGGPDHGRPIAEQFRRKARTTLANGQKRRQAIAQALNVSKGGGGG